MRIERGLILAGALAGLLGCTTTVNAADTATVKMNLVTNGAAKAIGQYFPNRLNLSTAKPTAVKKEPTMKSAQYGTLKFGPTEYLIALDQPTADTQAVYLDANANGDLTDDPAIKWELPPSNGN